MTVFQRDCEGGHPQEVYQESTTTWGTRARALNSVKTRAHHKAAVSIAVFW